METPDDDARLDRRTGTRGFERFAGVAGLVAVGAAIVAAATIWLLLTDPVTVATAVDEGQISPLIRELAEVIYNALIGLLQYL